MAKTRADDAELLSIDGFEVRISHPGKLYFSGQLQLTKLELVRYFLAVAPGALSGIASRAHRSQALRQRSFPRRHVQPEPFYQKRAPADLPPFIRTATLSFPSGRTADEVVVDSPRRSRLGRQPRLHRAPPAPRHHRRPRPPRPAPHRSRPPIPASPSPTCVK